MTGGGTLGCGERGFLGRLQDAWGGGPALAGSSKMRRSCRSRSQGQGCNAFTHLLSPDVLRSGN